MTTLGEQIQLNVEKYGWCKTGLDGIVLALLMRVGNIHGNVELDGKALVTIPAHQYLPDGNLDTMAIANELFQKEGGNVMHGSFVLEKSILDALGIAHSFFTVDGVSIYDYPRSKRLDEENEKTLTRILGQRCESCNERTHDESGVCPRCQEIEEKTYSHFATVADSYDEAGY